MAPRASTIRQVYAILQEVRTLVEVFRSLISRGGAQFGDAGTCLRKQQTLTRGNAEDDKTAVEGDKRLQAVAHALWNETLPSMRRTVLRFEKLLVKLSGLLDDGADADGEPDEYLGRLVAATRAFLSLHQADLRCLTQATESLLMSDGFRDDPNQTLAFQNYSRLLTLWSHPSSTLEGSRAVSEWLELATKESLQVAWGVTF